MSVCVEGICAHVQHTPHWAGGKAGAVCKCRHVGGEPRAFCLARRKFCSVQKVAWAAPPVLCRKSAKRQGDVRASYAGQYTLVFDTRSLCAARSAPHRIVLYAMIVLYFVAVSVKWAYSAPTCVIRRQDVVYSVFYRIKILTFYESGQRRPTHVAWRTVDLDGHNVSLTLFADVASKRRPHPTRAASAPFHATGVLHAF